MKKAFLESPKTTITGIIAGITMLAITFGFLSPDESSVVNKEIGVIISSVLTLLGIFSKDGDKD